MIISRWWSKCVEGNAIKKRRAARGRCQFQTNQKLFLFNTQNCVCICFNSVKHSEFALFYLYIAFPLWKVFRFWVSQHLLYPNTILFSLFFFSSSNFTFSFSWSCVLQLFCFSRVRLRFSFFFFFLCFAFSNLKNCNRKYKKKLVTFFFSFLLCLQWQIAAPSEYRYYEVEIIKQYFHFEIWARECIRFVSIRLICFHLFFIHGISFYGSSFYSLSFFVYIVVGFLVSVFEPQIDAQVIVSNDCEQTFRRRKTVWVKRRMEKGRKKRNYSVVRHCWLWTIKLICLVPTVLLHHHFDVRALLCVCMMMPDISVNQSFHIMLRIVVSLSQRKHEYKWNW